MIRQQRTERRILSIFLPEILCEIARKGRTLSLQESKTAPPMGVILTQRANEVRSQDRLAAVCARAFCAGVRPGQTPAEANVMQAGLQIEVVEQAQLQEHLLAIAEIAAQFGTTPSWNAQKDADTVWLDVSGIGHLYGSERQLCEELAEQVRFLGYRVRIAVASGPQIAQAVARFGHTSIQIIDSDMAASAEALADLPLAALPLDLARIAWLGQLGIFQVRQLALLPKAAASSRLGPDALSVLQLASGVDPLPLVPGAFPRSLQEESSWEEPVDGISPLLFVLRGIVARLSSRLKGRGEACSSIECELIHDPAVARHLQVLSRTVLAFELAAPLHQENDLERVIRARLEACKLLAPTMGFKVRVSQLTAQAQHQLGLQQKTKRSTQSGGSWTQEFPVLAAELQSDIGSEHVGTLSAVVSHVPEEVSIFKPLLSKKNTKAQKPAVPAHKLGLCPHISRLTRLLPYPQRLHVPLREGETFALGGQLYVIQRLRFVSRLAEAQWWKETSISRDYHWAWLRSGQGGTEALLFINRKNGEGFVQALRD